MEVNAALVDKLATLSRLSFSENEKEKITHDLQRMISFVEKLSELDTTGIEPLRHMGVEQEKMREDITSGMVSQDEALRNAPDHDHTFFIVPKVIRK